MIQRRSLLLAFVPSLLILAGGAQAQVRGVPAKAGDGGWNSPRALELIERARSRRAVPRADSGLVNYQASATGHVYFFLDRADSEERALVKADQIALEVYWAAPNQTKQRIVGLRDASKLPNQMHYHLDHLTIVQDEFGDLIRLGDGDEVRDVVHPAAPGSGRAYDFRLADSMTIRLAGAVAPIHVHELEVRPRHPDRPAFVGSIFLDQATAAIVRMNFTFTPASYVDRRLDYIRVGLDNGLWDGRYWLPNEQTLEIRRQVPILDFPTGGIIRGVFRISDYQFNQELPPGLFHGARIVAAPPSERESHEFTAGIYDGLAAEEITATTDLAALRRQAISLLGQRYLSGLPKLRLYLPNSSAALRYNRAEAFYLGGGLSYATSAASRLRLTTGFATGPAHVALTGDWQVEVGSGTGLWLSAERNGLRDIGLRQGVPGIVNTIAAAGFGEDFLDPYFTTRAAAGIERRLDQDWTASITAAYERHRGATLEETSAILDGEAAFREIRSIAEGSLVRTTVALSRGMTSGRTLNSGRGWSGQFNLEAGRFVGAGYLRPTAEAAISRRASDQNTALEIRGAAGLVTGAAPPQRLFLLGGPATLPGYPYRVFVGDRFALFGLEVSRDLAAPWVRLRAVGAAGWADLGSAAPPADWEARATAGLRTSLGAGVGLFYDLLRLDLVRGLRRGEWQWVISVSPALGDIL